MPDPHDTLAIFAEVSIGLAGFSGIVVALGRRSFGKLSALEIRRLSNLFTLSGMALVLSLLGVSLLHIEFQDPNVLWSWGSAIVFLSATPWLIRDMVRVHRLEASEKAKINRILIFTFDSMAVVVLLLQLANWMSINEAWPFFVALVLIVVGALQQFILLVRTGIHDGAFSDV